MFPERVYIGCYRVFNKEGQKVKAYYAPKKGILGSLGKFILTQNYKHLIILIKVLKYFTLKLILRHLYLFNKKADFGQFRPTMVSWLNRK